MITVLYRPNPQVYFHAFFPIITSTWYKEFTFTDDVTYCLNKDSNQVILVLGIFKGNYKAKEQNIALLVKLKNKYRKVVFVDDSDGADSLHVELIPYVDLYYKKQLLKDRSAYLKPAYGRQSFSQYYHTQFGVNDVNLDNREPLNNPSELSKLRLLWNIGAAAYPKSKIKRKLSYWLGTGFMSMQRNIFYPEIHKQKHIFKVRNSKIQARFSYSVYSPSIGYQRKLMLEKLSYNTDILTGRVNQSQFNSEMKSVLAVLSPFGWGEICHRDFEAFVYGTLLIKPNCSHLETWPNVFIENETYIPLNWDFETLNSVCEKVLFAPDHYTAIANNGYLHYFNELESMKVRVEQFISEVLA